MNIHRNRVSVCIPDHGQFECSAYTLDQLMLNHQAKTLLQLKGMISDRTGVEYDDVHDRSALLFILGEAIGEG